MSKSGSKSSKSKSGSRSSKSNSGSSGAKSNSGSCDAKSNSGSCDAKSNSGEDKWEQTEVGRGAEHMAIVQVEQRQEDVSKRLSAEITMRSAGRLVTRADMLPSLTAPKAPPDPATARSAAVTMQRFWRRHKPFDTYHLLQTFHEQGPTVERVKSIRCLKACGSGRSIP